MQDGLCYLCYDGKPVKASRLFTGYEHEQATKKLALHFQKPVDYYESLKYNSGLVLRPAEAGYYNNIDGPAGLPQSGFLKRDLSSYSSYEHAYHQLISDIVGLQVHSTQMVMHGAMVSTIYVDGGFSKNEIFMKLLALSFRNQSVLAATLPQASSIGAALAMHRHWNTEPVRGDIIALKKY